MSNAHDSQREIRSILRLLETTARIVETSPVIDPDDGGTRCARQFNNALDRLAELGAVPEGLFEPLETDAAFSDICFACHQVAAYLREGCTEDFDFAQMKKTIGDELKDVGEVVRQSMPDFLKDIWGERSPENAGANEPETVEVTSDEEDEIEPTTTVEQRIAKLEGQMETVVDILQEIRAQQIDQNTKS